MESGIDLAAKLPQLSLNEEEKTLINLLYQYPKTVLAAGDNFSPALIANYCYDLAKQFNHFYQDTPIFKEEDAAKRLLRLKLSRWVSLVLRSGMGLLGIEVPEKM